MEGMETEFCSCDYYDSDPVEMWREKWPKARKSYRCIECGCEIKSGEQYQAISYKAEDQFWYEKTCATCARIRRDYCAPLGCLRDEIWYALGIDYITGEIKEN